MAGTVDIADVDPDLDTADADIRSTMQKSLARPTVAREDRPAFGASATRRTGRQKSKRHG